MSRDRVVEFSKVVFGSERRLIVLHAIATASEDDLYPTKIGSISGIGTGRASDELRKFSEIGLLERVEPDSAARRVLYQRNDSPIWGTVSELVKRLGAESR